MDTAASVEKLIIKGGLGAIQCQNNECGIEIKPLTVFIGPQGTGKSLVSQLLYFLRDAEYLLARYSGDKTGALAVRKVVEGLRTGDLTQRALASFATAPTAVHVKYVDEAASIERTISIQRGSRRITPIKSFKNEVNAWFEEWVTGETPRPHTPQAWFIPAERMFFSRFINTDPGIMGHPALPYPMREFARILTQAGERFQNQQKKAQEEAIIERLVHTELGGKIHYSRRGRYSGKWQWKITKERVIEVEMISSGQMESWPLVFVAQDIFRLRESGGPTPKYLHIEEPEAHLHPQAQVAIAKLIAYLVNQGIRVVMTTHSLTILYAINNLLLAYKILGKEAQEEGMPQPEVRLDPAMVSAYLFVSGEKPQKIMDESAGQVDEGRLGEVLGNLEVEFNRIAIHPAHRE